MRFHSTCHGRNITLSEDATTATRTASFNHGITFGAQPLAPLKGITVEFKSLTSSWSGALRYGLTNHNPEDIDPESLPQYAIPDLNNKEGYWAKALSQNKAQAGFKLTYHYTDQGTVVTFVNNEHIETAELKNGVDISKPIWALLDVYGCTQCIRLIEGE